MKQKRTVKSLLPSKYKVGENFFTVLLLTLSVMLCIWAATLMTTSVWAAAGEGIDNVYSSMNDDKVEVLYRMEFSDPENLYDENGEPVDNFYMEDNILYVSPSMVRVKDAGNTWNYSFLWWVWNKVETGNVTMLAWYKNIVGDHNNNASVLWWSGNKVDWNSNQFPVIAWWNGNQIDDNKWNVILWWDKNIIQHSVDSVILWWESNETTGNNVIIWWKKVKILKGNIFAFSNEELDFKPQTEKAFYLNLTKGVWINADSEKSGMAVWGAVWFWSVDWETCNSNNNIWVEWILNLGGYGCLVWCTEKSKSSGKWELLDRWENCEKECATSNKCMNFTEWNSNENQNYIGYCSQGIPEWAIKCTSWEWESYTNVVFQTLKVDSLADCEKVGDNKCAYYCESDDCVADDEPINNPDMFCKWEFPSGAKRVDGWVDGDAVWTYYANVNDRKTCAYECVPTYSRDWSKCEPAVYMCNTAGVWKPENSDYDIVFDKTPKNCGWKCNPGFTQSGDSCVLNKCLWDDPLNAYFLAWSDEWLGSDTQKQVIKYSDKDDNTKKCAYLCESWFVAVIKDFGWWNRGYVCDQCESWTQDPKNPDVCVRVEDCPDGYVRDSSMGTGCYLKWVGRYKDGAEYTWLSLWRIVWKTWDILPITSQDFRLKCIDGDKYKWEVEPYTCRYQCQPWYYCNGVKCEKPQCRSRSDFGKDDDGKYYYYSTWIAGHYDFHRSYTMVFVTGNNITTPEEFYAEYHNKSGCYYWCPLENRYYIANSVFLWRCGSLWTVEANQKKCGKIYLYWYGVSVKKPQVDKQAWQYTGNYQAVKDGVLSCTWSCEPGSQVMFATRMTENTTKDIEQYGYPKRLFLTWSSGKICYKECKKDGKFMNDHGKCESCQAGYKLDENQLWTSVINGVTYQEYRWCTPDCPDWTVWQNNACMLKEIWWICPEGYVSEWWNCYKCLGDFQVYVQWKWCIDKV